MSNSPFDDELAPAVSSFYIYLDKLINTFSNHRKYTILAVADIGLFAISICVAIGWEYGLDRLPTEILHYSNFVVLEIAIKIGSFWIFGIYRQILQYTGREFVFTIAQAVATSCLTIAVTDRLFLVSTIPLSVLFSDGMLALMLAITFRLGVRLTRGEMRQIVGGASPGENRSAPPKTNVIIYGAGGDGRLLAQALARESSKKLIGFVDDAAHLQGRNVGGIRVYAPAELLKLKARIGLKKFSSRCLRSTANANAILPKDSKS
jgi:FlaA1/EpsC-like NDP-sugar epimerase